MGVAKAFVTPPMVSLRRATKKLKSSGIKGIFVFLPSRVLDHDLASIFGHVLYRFVNSGIYTHSLNELGAIGGKDSVC